jgi:glycosyltransferase involved in cell wall biosynthesis
MSVNKGSKFTVIIPTRERADTLQYSLKTVVAQDYDNLEILISDNFSCDDTEDVVRSFKDSRIVYKNTGKRLSMSHNWEFALSHVNSGWVTILGDDDGLLPGALSKVSEIIEETGVLAIRSRVCSYSWPGVGQHKYGQLTVPINSGFEVRDTETWLSKVLKGYANYFDLPMLYNGGFGCSSLIKKIRSRNGTFYQSLNPDVYSAVALSSTIPKYIYSNEPFAINGTSKHSIGTAAFSGNNELKDSPVRKFFSEDNIPFHPDIPLYPDGSYPRSLQAIVYESYLQAKNIPDKAQKSMHQQQLEVILATAGRHEASVREWGKIFATTHGLNYDEIQSKANRKKMVLNLFLFLRLLSRAINTYSVVGSPEFPVKDVYEASLRARAIRNAMPSRLKNIPRVVGRAVERIIRTGGRIAF